MLALWIFFAIMMLLAGLSFCCAITVTETKEVWRHGQLISITKETRTHHGLIALLTYFFKKPIGFGEKELD